MTHAIDPMDDIARGDGIYEGRWHLWGPMASMKIGRFTVDAGPSPELIIGSVARQLRLSDRLVF